MTLSNRKNEADYKRMEVKNTNEEIKSYSNCKEIVLNLLADLDETYIFY